MRRARLLQYFLVALLFGCARSTQPPEKGYFGFEMHRVDETFAHRSRWVASYTGGNKIRVKVEYLNAESLDSEFTVSPQSLDGIRRSLSEQRFFEIPSVIAPTRATNLVQIWLDVTQDGRTHSVWAMDPDSLVDNADFLRFQAIVNVISASLPVHPPGQG
jgi:hypothetical protein